MTYLLKVTKDYLIYLIINFKLNIKSDIKNKKNKLEIYRIIYYL